MVSDKCQIGRQAVLLLSVMREVSAVDERQKVSRMHDAGESKERVICRPISIGTIHIHDELS